MGYRARELFRQEFTSTDFIAVEHNLDREYIGVRVLIGEDQRQDLLQRLTVDLSSPTNICYVKLRSVQTGVIQITDYDPTGLGDLSADQLVSLGFGESFVLGENYHYIEDLSTVTNNNTSFFLRLRLNVSGIPDGIYYIGLSLVWNGSSQGSQVIGRLLLDSTTEIWRMREEPVDPGSDQRYPATAYVFQELSAGSHTIDFEWQNEFLNNSSTIDPRIEFWRIF